MPNGREHLKYENFGPHLYDREKGTSDCRYSCGCWSGPTRSGGPAGIDPFGKCPNNPLKRVEKLGKELTDQERREDLIEARIEFLILEIRNLKPFQNLVLKSKRGSKIKQQEEIERLKKDIISLKQTIHTIQRAAIKIHKEIISV